MLLKTYRGTDLATALQQARAELGPDALVLDRKVRRGRLGLSVAEVTVAAPRAVGSSDSRSDPVLAGLAREVDEANGRSPRLRTNTSPPSGAQLGQDRTPREFNGAVEALVASGLSRDLARRLANMAGQRVSPSADALALARATVRGVDELIDFAPIPLNQRCLFVVGPPGSGKTTTVAKLAVRAKLARSGPVFFADADTEGIGSFDRADVYCRHIGAQAARINDVEDLRYTLRHAGDHGTVLVDTAGIGAADPQRLQELSELRREVPDAGLAVLVPMGLQHSEAGRVLTRFREISPTCVGFSRIDDGNRPGELLTALASQPVPLAFFTNGHRIPDDLEPATPHRLAKMLFRVHPGAHSAESVA